MMTQMTLSYMFQTTRTKLKDILGLFDLKYVTWWQVCFQNKIKINLNIIFLAIHIMCTSDEARCIKFSLQKLSNILIISKSAMVIILNIIMRPRFVTHIFKDINILHK